MAKKEKQRVSCINCKHSTLTQRNNDPVISKCEHQLYRQVARQLRICEHYAKATGQKKITKYSHLN